MRTITAVRLLVVAAVTTLSSTSCRAEPDPTGTLHRAVDRTIDSGSLRFRGRVVPSSGETVTIAGVASLSTDATTVSATAGDARGAPSAEVRMTAGRAWMRPPGGSEWVPIPRHSVEVAGIGSWRGLLERVRSASDVTRTGHRRLRGRLRDGAVTVSVGPTGRIHAISLVLPGGAVELDLFDFGAEVDASPPP